MKKIAVILGKIGPKKQLFLDYLTTRLKSSIEIIPVLADDLSIFTKQGKTTIKALGQPIENFNLIYFRRIGNKNLSIANIISDYLRKRDIDFIDSALLVEGRGEDKLTNNYLLSEAGVPVIPMTYSNNWNEIVSFLNLPLIAKDIDKQRTEGIYTIRSQDDFTRLKKDNPTSRFVFEKFMNIKIEYRLLVMGDKVRTVLIKDTRNYTFKVSTPAGIPEKYLDPTSISDSFKKIAVEAAKILGLEVAGVDLMVEEDSDKPYIIEVNRGPGITIEVNKSPELPELANFLEERLAEN